MGMDDFARAAAFSVWLEDALAGTLATWTGGTVVLDPAAPDVWDSNHLRLERRWDEAPEVSNRDQAAGRAIPRPSARVLPRPPSHGSGAPVGRRFPR